MKRGGHLIMRIPIVVFMIVVGVVGLVGPSRADTASPSPAASPGVDLGSKTSGIGTDVAAQPSAAPKVRVGPDGHIDPAELPDTPGQTGLGNKDQGPMGGAAKGPGTAKERAEGRQ